MQKIEAWFANTAISKPFSSLIGSLLILIFLGYGLKWSQFDADPSIYFSDDHYHYRMFKQLEEDYGRVDSIMMVISAKEGDLFTKENLHIIEQVSEQAWTFPYANRVQSLSSYNFTESEDDEMIVEPLIEDALNFTEEDVQKVKQIALTDPDIVRRLVSPDKPMAMIRVIAALPKVDRQAEEREMATAALKVAEEIEANYPHLDVLLSGNVISNNEVTDVATHDTMTIIPMMYLVIFVMLGLFLRSLFAVFAIILVTTLSVIGAMGAAAWSGIVLNMMSMMSVNIIVTVAIAHCVHILVYFLQTYHSGASKVEALAQSLKINLTPITLTSVTTALGFISMNLSKMPPAHDLGNITAMGVMIAFILSLLFLPPLLLVLPIKKRQLSDGGQFNKMMDSLATFVIQKRTGLLVVTLIASLSIVSFAPMNIMNDRFTENVKMPNQFRIDNQEMDKHFGGLYTIDYDFKAAPDGSISDPEYLLALEKFANWMREQPGVRSVQSYSDIVKRLNKNMHNDDPAYYKIPETRDEAAQYQLLFEMSQPAGVDQSNMIRVDKTATRMIVYLPSTDTMDLIELQQRAQAWIKQNMPDYMYYPGEGIAVMWAYLGQEAIIDGLKGATLALLLISVILTLVFRSIKYGLISLIPNLLPAGVGYGIWALLNGQLSMGQMLVLSLTIGIVVDDTVHFLSKYLRAKQQNNASSQDAVRYAFKQVGPALWITTAVLMLGFGMLYFSGFIPNSNLGLLTVSIIFAALTLDFFLLPPLLMLIDRKKEKAKQAVSANAA
ncbi:MAG: efflux RND transporter permease subunit [Cellvibrionales bacterium]|nr:efflux RND transporter permease subunit [Cellvibrionales bacterium]